MAEPVEDLDDALAGLAHELAEALETCRRYRGLCRVIDQELAAGNTGMARAILSAGVRAIEGAPGVRH